MRTAIVKSMSQLEVINSESTVFEVEFDNGDKALLIAEPYAATKYINQMVEYEIEKNLYNMELRDFIASMGYLHVVNTINRKEGFKLFSDNEDTCATVAFKDLEMGQVVNGAILYCSKVEWNSSAKTDWLDLTVSDRFRRVARLRIFSPTVTDASSIAGSYIKCNIRMNKFGLTTQDISVMDMEYAPNPELLLAETYINEMFKDDEDMQAVLSRTNLISFMREYVRYERGDLLLECAMELDIAQSLGNVTPGIDIDAICKALIAEKLWVTQPNTHYSKEFLCLHKTLQFKNAFDAKVQDIIGGDVPNVPDERLVFNKVKELVRAIVKVRKGDVCEN